MFPRGIPSAALPVAVTSALRPGQLPRQPHLRLVVTRILRPPHPARPAGRRNPPPRFRSASPPPGSPPTPSPRRSSAPRPAASCSCLTPCLRPPRIPSQRSGNCASGTSFVSSTSHARAATSGRYGVKCCPRHSRRFRAPIVACAAWSILRDHLTPRPAVAKSSYRFCVRKIRWATALQKTTGGAGKFHLNPRVPGEVGWASMVQAVMRERRCSWLQSAVSINPSHPPPLAAAARGVAK